MNQNQNILKQFLALESASGIILFIAALIAIIWANSPFSYVYTLFRHELVLFSINDGLMALFFLIVGLELKRNYLEGNFAHLKEILLPLTAAIGGMIIPALIYVLFNYNNASTLSGATIPVATDIAFALGVLSLFGKRVPLSLKLFLLALAIFDDIGAIIIIAAAYTHDISYAALSITVLLLATLYVFNRCGIKQLGFYLLIGVILWFCIFKSGIHPTIAGVLLAFFIPYHNVNSKQSPLVRLEKNLHPYVAYLVMPLFALTNTGFPLPSITYEILMSGIVLGITFGLFIGKQIGIFGCSWFLIQLKYARLPYKTTWASLYGVALLGGIGFTMSLFLGTLSFQNETLHLAEVRLGVIIGSILSGVCGSFVLRIALPHKRTELRRKHIE